MDQAGDGAAKLRQHAARLARGLAVVYEQGLAEAGREFHLRSKHAPLIGAAGIVAIVVEAGLADRHNEWMRRKRVERGQPAGRDRAGVVRMHAGGSVQCGRVVLRRRRPLRGIADGAPDIGFGAALRQCQRLVAGGHACAGDDQSLHAGRRGASEHLIAVAIEGAVGEVDADVYHGGVMVLSCAASTGGWVPASRA